MTTRKAALEAGRAWVGVGGPIALTTSLAKLWRTEAAEARKELRHSPRAPQGPWARGVPVEHPKMVIQHLAKLLLGRHSCIQTG